MIGRYVDVLARVIALLIVAGNVANSEIDPLVEILKYAFVLRLSLRRVSEAEQLEDLINELYINAVNVETVIQPVLRLLIELKSFRTDTGTVQVLAFVIN